MPKRPFDRLHRRMVAAGVRVPSADRMCVELVDHLAELERELVAAGMSPAEAARQARTQLGRDDVLVAEAIARAPRSFLHAHPVLTFVLGPLIGAATTLPSAHSWSSASVM